MQALLSFDKAPPFAAPLRFFLTAPIFLALAAGVMLYAGEDGLGSRWAPATLAMTHLVTIGFMLQVMLGALIQILPVVAGANLPHPLALSRGVHLGLSVGCLLLAAGFLLAMPELLVLATLLLGVAVSGFLLAGLLALWAVPSTSPTIRGLKLSLVGLAGLLGLGGLLALAMAWGWSLPLPALTDLHVGWALGAWGGVLLASVAYVVVPMFQLTPGYPARPSWWLPVGILTALVGWAACLWVELDAGVRLAQAALAMQGMAFALQTLKLQSLRRRAKVDVTYRYWQLGLVCAIVALGMLLCVAIVPAWADAPEWTLIFGILLLGGGFIPFIAGMLFKILPFLAWLHLQNEGQGKVPAPPMNKLLPETWGLWQYRLHVLACLVLLAAVFAPAQLARPAACCCLLASLSLAGCLFAGTRRYQRQRRQILEAMQA